MNKYYVYRLEPNSKKHPQARCILGAFTANTKPITPNTSNTHPHIKRFFDTYKNYNYEYLYSIRASNECYVLDHMNDYKHKDTLNLYRHYSILPVKMT